MDKVITSGLLIIASIVAAIALINAVIPAMSESSGALVTANSSAADRIRTDIEVVHVASDTSGVPGEDQIIIWVKNVGSNKISPIESSDIFLDMSSTVKQLSHGSGSGSEYWDYTIENGAEWTQGVTVRMVAHLSDGSVTPGTYSVLVTLYNAVSASKDFSV